MSAVQWFSGPPPAVGWWPAAAFGFLDLYRWWNGAVWSAPVGRSTNARYAGYEALSIDAAPHLIKWRHWSIEIDGTDGRGAHE